MQKMSACSTVFQFRKQLLNKYFAILVAIFGQPRRFFVPILMNVLELNFQDLFFKS